jgi:alpha-tubulin suppressor-like RCC1 family protein
MFSVLLAVLLFPLSALADARLFPGEVVYGTIPQNNRRILDAAEGQGWTLYLTIDGTLVHQGNLNAGVGNLPTPNSGFVAIDAGRDHAVALRSDGSLVAWGSNSHGQCDVPVSASGYLKVRAGEYHTLALRGDSTLVAWGNNSLGQCDVPLEDSVYREISTGKYHSIAIRTDGSVLCWGNNGYEECNPPEPNADFVDVAAGDYFSSGLREDGTIVCWGAQGRAPTGALNGGYFQVEASGGTPYYLRSDGTIRTSQGNYSSIPVSDLNTRIHATASGVTAIRATPHVLLETFNHEGELPEGWTIETRNQARTTPWSPVQQADADWAMGVVQSNYEFPFNEWLISPVLDFRNVDITMVRLDVSGYTTGNTFTMRVSQDAGITWTSFAFGNSFPYPISFDPGTLLDNQQDVRLAFVFEGAFFGEASVTLDNLELLGTPTPPVASQPVPAQPPAPASGFHQTVGCDWTHTHPVNGSQLQIRVDMDQDGYYQGGGLEDWHLLPDQEDSTLCRTVTELQFAASGSPHFELRARAGFGNWGYSGSDAQPGMMDDWQVNIPAPPDSLPPVLDQAVPVTTSDTWFPARTVEVGCRITDTGSGVDPTSLAMRVDWNHNGVYDGETELWQPLTGYPAGQEIEIREVLQFPEDGHYRLDIRAWDMEGNGPVYLGGTAGPESDLQLGIDTVAPTAPVLISNGSSSHAVSLQFSPTVETNFSHFEIDYSPDSVFDASDPIWGPANDPSLAQQYLVTNVLGLEYGHLWAFRVRAVDKAGNSSPASNAVYRVAGGSRPAAIMDLHLEVSGDNLVLSWTPPLVDEHGQGPVGIQSYKVIAGTSPTFEPFTYSEIRITHEPRLVLPLGNQQNRLFFRVTAEGAGPGDPSDARVVAVGNPSVDFSTNNSSIRAISPGNTYLLGLHENGSLEFWGNWQNSSAHHYPPGPNEGFTAIASGLYHGLALREDGSIAAWGSTGESQEQVPEPNADFIAIAAGYSHSLGLKADGHLVMWGSNYHGQLDCPAPDSVFVVIAAGHNRSAAVTVGGRVYYWGPNGSLSPLPGTDFQSVSISSYVLVALRRNGQIVSPYGLPSPNYGFTSVACGNSNWLALRQDGTVYSTFPARPNPNTDITSIAGWDNGNNNSIFYAIRRVPLSAEAQATIMTNHP